jgi:hypothetical protein
MQLTLKELEELTFKAFPDPFLKALAETVFLAKKSGCELCQARYADTEAENIRGLIQRANLEYLMRSAADRYNIGQRVIKEPGQQWNHTELFNNSVILTAASVAYPGAMVKKADYRVGLAESNMSIYDIIDGDDRSDDVHLYAVLIHSQSRWQTREDRENYRHLPGSVFLAFPASDIKSYIHSINLLDRYPELFRKYAPRGWSEETLLKYIQQTRRRAI